MSIEPFYESPITIASPLSYDGSSYAQLRKLFFHSESGLLIGVFIQTETDYDYEDSVQINKYVMLNMWKDGTFIHSQINGSPINPTLDLSSFEHIPVVSTSNGRVARVRGYHYLMSYLTNVGLQLSYYIVDPIVSSGLLCGPSGITSSTNLSPNNVGIINELDGTTIQPRRISGVFSLRKNPGAEIKFSSGSLLFEKYRDIFQVDRQRIAVTFAPQVDGNPTRIVIFNTDSSPYTIEFQDELPDLDDVAAYDMRSGILYTAKRKLLNGSKIHASILKRYPSSISTPTIAENGVSALRELTATRISTLVLDGLGSVISNQVVRWILASQVSQGFLQSAYSLTNNSGVATIVYVGPLNPPPSLQESITAQVATI